MKLVLNKASLPILFEFILFISSIEFCFSFLFQFFGIQRFAMIPYLRLVVLFFSFLYLLKNRLIAVKQFYKISIKLKSENVLVLLWIIFVFTGFFIGILQRNPILYLFTDVIYIFCGYFFYRIFSSNQILLQELSVDLTKKQENKFVILVFIFSIIGLLLKVELPSFLVVFSLAFSIYLYNKKEYKSMVLSVAPFLLQIITSNRALLIVFIIIIFFALVQNKFSKKNIMTFLLLCLFLLIFSFFFLDDFLKLFIDFLPDNSTLKHRLAQIYFMLKGNVNWNSPSFLSLKQRIDEAEAVVKFWCSSPINFLFGGGMGATMEGFSFKDGGVTGSALLGKSSVHNIHLLPFSLIFRHGLLGIVLFCILIYNLVKYLFNIILSDKSLFKTLIVFQFCWILYSFSAASYLWTCPLFWITLAYISNEKKIKFS